MVMRHHILNAIEVLPDGGRLILHTLLHSHTSQPVTARQEPRCISGSMV